jgi:hypothetical protein
VNDGPLTPAHLRVIEAFANKAVEDYLREEAAARAAAEAERTNPVPLSGYDQAA